MGFSERRNWLLRVSSNFLQTKALAWPLDAKVRFAFCTCQTRLTSYICFLDRTNAAFFLSFFFSGNLPLPFFLQRKNKFKYRDAQYTSRQICMPYFSLSSLYAFQIALCFSIILHFILQIFPISKLDLFGKVCLTLCCFKRSMDQTSQCQTRSKYSP